MAAASTEVGGRTTKREGPLHILTLNINGLKKNGKKLLNELEKSKKEVDVLFLSETHAKDIDAWNDYENWEIYPTCYDPRPQGCFNFRKKITKGAAVLVNKNRDFEFLEKEVDEKGRYVILKCKISERLCTFVSVYHRSDERQLLKELSEKIKPLNSDILVVGGDFNTALDEKKDTTSKSNNHNHRAIRTELQSFLQENSLEDAWRRTNSDRYIDGKEYTYKYNSKFRRYYSRLDYIFINADKWELVQDCRINRDNISNHRSVSLILQ